MASEITRDNTRLDKEALSRLGDFNSYLGYQAALSDQASPSLFSKLSVYGIGLTGVIIDYHQYRAARYSPLTSFTLAGVQFGVTFVADAAIGVVTTGATVATAATGIGATLAPVVPYAGLTIAATTNYAIGNQFHTVFDGSPIVSTNENLHWNEPFTYGLAGAQTSTWSYNPQLPTRVNPQFAYTAPAVVALQAGALVDYTGFDTPSEIKAANRPAPGAPTTIVSEQAIRNLPVLPQFVSLSPTMPFTDGSGNYVGSDHLVQPIQTPGFAFTWAPGFDGPAPTFNPYSPSMPFTDVGLTGGAFPPPAFDPQTIAPFGWAPYVPEIGSYGTGPLTLPQISSPSFLGGVPLKTDWTGAFTPIVSPVFNVTPFVPELGLSPIATPPTTFSGYNPYSGTIYTPDLGITNAVDTSKIDWTSGFGPASTIINNVSFTSAKPPSTKTDWSVGNIINNTNFNFTFNANDDDFDFNFNFTIPFPVLLDISGNGLTIDPLSSSSQFLDLGGDGYQHRTAWVGKGTGVLVLDADGNNKISRSNEYIFTEWDSSATGDLEAIRNVFDSNHNGKLDAGDARWAEFKVLVDGEMKTLDQLDIASIDLTPKGTGQNFADGSAITGTTEFTRTDGTKGTVGDAVLANDPNGYVLKRSSVTNADGSVSEDILAYNKDGSVAFRNLVTTSADGNNVRTQFDDDGNGTVNRSQTDVLSVGSDGSRTRTVSNFNADGSLLNSTRTIRSADGKTITTHLDQNGDGQADQSEVFLTNGDGSSTTTTKALSFDGSLIKQIKITSSADGLTRTTQTDSNGDGVFELTAQEITVIDTDGNRTKTVNARSPDGSLIASTVTQTSADNRTKTVKYDNSGNGVFDKIEKTVIEVDAKGLITATTSSFNTDGSLRGKTITVTSADGLIRTTSLDLTGDGIIDRVSSKTTVIGSDKSRTQTLEEKGGNGTVLSKTVTTASADGKTITIDEDKNGDGSIDARTNILVAEDGLTTTIRSIFNPDGLLLSKSVSETSADGKTVTTQTDVNGDGTFDKISKDVTTANTDGSQVRTVTTFAGDSAVLNKSVTATSADSLTQSVAQDLDGDGITDRTLVTAIALNVDGSRGQTTTTQAGDGTLLSRVISVTSADRKITSVKTDENGDGNTDLTEVQVINADGSKIVTSTRTNSAGVVLAKSETTTSADGLTVSTRDDVDGDGAFDKETESTTILNTDGSRTTTTVVSNGTTVATRTIISISANGLVKTTASDNDGDGSTNNTVTETVIFNPDGSTTKTAESYRGSTLAGKTITTVSANGLASTAQIDTNGDGAIDRIVTSIRTLNSDGSVTESATARSADGTLLSKSVTNISANGRATTVDLDSNGNGIDERTATVINADGSTTMTRSKLNMMGGIISKTVMETSANGWIITTRTDENGDGTFERTTKDITVVNVDGSQTQTITISSGNGAMISKSVITSSGNGLIRTIGQDLNGDGAIDKSTATAIVLNADGSRQQTDTIKAGNGVVLSKTVTLTSADRKMITVSTDENGDGKTDLTEIQILNADGSRTVTATRTNAVGAILSKTVTLTSADGLTVTTTKDTDGNDVFEEKTVSVTSLDKDGSRTTAITFYRGTTVVSKTVTTVSANGLIKTVTKDLDGDGDIDSKSVEKTGFDPNGQPTTVTSNYSGTSMISEVLERKSANGLVSKMHHDSDGDGSIDRDVVSTRTLNRDGSIIDTALTSTNGVLISKTTATTSADKKTTTIDSDTDGDDKVDMRQVSNTLGDGTTRQTTSRLNADGTLLSKSVTETSGNGLVKIVRTDANGDGTYESEFDTSTILNADGSRTTSIAELGETGARLSLEAITDSASGLSRFTDWSGNGGTLLVSATERTTINADGSTVKTTRFADGRNTTVTVSSDGRTKTTERNVYVTTKPTQKEVEVRNADGSFTTTLTEYDRDSITATARKIITRSGNGLVETTDYDIDGNGSVNTRVLQITTLNSNGSRTQSTSTFAGITSGLVLKSKVVVDVSANGLEKTTRWDMTGAGSYDRTETDITVLNANGSQSRTVSTLNGAALDNRKLIETSANGLSITTQWNTLGGSVYDQKSTDVTVLDSFGTKTRTITSTKSGVFLAKSFIRTSIDGRTITVFEESSDGSVQRSIKTVKDIIADGSTRLTQTTTDANDKLLDKAITTTSVNGRKVMIERDANGDGKIDQIEKRTQAVDGSIKVTLENRNTNGTLASQMTSTVSADGRTTKTDWDFSGTGVYRRRSTRVDTLNADGSQTSTTTDTDDTGKLLAKTDVIVSADGHTRNMTRDINGDGTIDQTETTVVDPTGSQFTLLVNNSKAREGSSLTPGAVHWNPAIAAKVETRTSADGLTKTVFSDYDGDGTFEYTEVSRTQIDGSVVTTVTEKNKDGSISSKGTIVTSADGLVVVLSKDIGGDNKIERTQTSVAAIDGSVTLTSVDRSADGTVKQTTVDTIGASGKLQRSLTIDALGREIAETMRRFMDDGTTLETTYELAALPWKEITVKLDKADKKIFQQQTNDDGTRIDTSYIAATGKEQLTNFFSATNILTGTTTYDFNNTQVWTTINRTYDTAKRITRQIENNDDATRYDRSYDYTTTVKWSSVNRTYNKAGDQTAETQFMDDETHVNIVFDPSTKRKQSVNFFDKTNTLIQSKTYNVALDTLSLIKFYEAGKLRRSIEYRLAASDPLTQIERFYDTAGETLFQVETRDDKTRIERRFDIPNLDKVYLRVDQVFNAANQKTSEIQYLDNGTRIDVWVNPVTQAITLQRNYDANNTLVFDSVADATKKAARRVEVKEYDGYYREIETTYDGYNRILKMEIEYDTENDIKTVADFDLNDTQPWQVHVQLYNKYDERPENRFGEYFVYDNGSGVAKAQNDGTDYKSIFFDTNGRVTKVVGSGDHQLLFMRPLPFDLPFKQANTRYNYGQIKGFSVLLDINGDGKIDIVQLAAGNIGPHFNWNGQTGDGERDPTAWVGPKDGMLVIDLDGDQKAGADGKIDNFAEVNFSYWKTPEERQAELAAKNIADVGQPTTTLEGLRFEFDTNRNNLLDAQDTRWNEFRIWQDLNQDGDADAGELKTLNEAGIKLINLMANVKGTQSFADGSSIVATSTAQRINGTNMLLAEAALSYRSLD